MRVLTVNAGSSSLKLRLLGDDDESLASADLSALAGRAEARELEHALAGMEGADAVGHRIVHGGTRFTGPTRLDAAAVAGLRELTPLAPLHQPAALEAMAAVGALLPDLPAVACIDTAFHAGLPAAASTYGLPRDWRERHGLRRFGFHGLSHAYASRRAAEMVGRGAAEAPGAGAAAAALRVVSCHLGAGASLAAIDGGRSVDTTMGFTPVEGLVMATRSGSVDPGLLVWLLQHGGIGVDELADALEHRSGLAGLAGTGDMRTVLEAARAGEEDAVLARDVYVHRLRALIAAMAAALGGLDALVFTGGVGERASEIRTRAAGGLAFLGVAVDAGRDAAAAPDADISAPGAAVRTLVIEAREDLEMARQVRACLG
ncbi:MAG TPA: acetate/propionate family kinase [Solirubrobacteraceae bacterium]|nr:acetate/propionate family kinase [Solirubrobacteraceae bacterium]